MKQIFHILAASLGCLTFTAADWPQFRGPAQHSIAPGSELPVEFTPEKNVAWKSPLPGRGVSSPIVVGGKVIVTATSWPKQDRLYVIAFDEKSGKEAWRREFWATGRPFTHPTSANAAPSPASDGKRIYAFFSSNDLACLDLDGNLVWYRGLTFDYPNAGNDVGMSSSPVVVDGVVVVQVENMSDSFAAGVKADTGEHLWRIGRKASSNWASPTVMAGRDRNLVLLQSPDKFTAHDPRTGNLVWEFKAECNVIASSTAEGSKVYLPANGLVKLDLNASANEPVVDWETARLAPDNATPVVQGDNVYIINGAGVLSCGNVENGEQRWQVRLPGKVWATPVIAGDKAYIATQDGKVHVVGLGEKGKLLATNELGEPFLGSPAVVGNALFLRSDKHLWKIME